MTVPLAEGAGQRTFNTGNSRLLRACCWRETTQSCFSEERGFGPLMQVEWLIERFATINFLCDFWISQGVAENKEGRLRGGVDICKPAEEAEPIDEFLDTFTLLLAKCLNFADA